MPKKTPPYRIELFYSEEDEGFIARLFQFHAISAFGDTQEEALQELQVAVKNWLAALRKRGEEPPEPLDTKKYSGNFRLRVPEDLHRELTVEAVRHGVSLNTFCLIALQNEVKSRKVATRKRG